MRKMLFISNFPFSKPFHGGQIRSNELYQKYKELGFDVKILVVKPEETYLDQKSDFEFIVSLSEFAHEVEKVNELLDDYACYQYSEKYLDKIVKKVGVDYDFVHCEMPWLFPIAYEIKKRSNKKLLTIFGSENVESVLKAQILKKAGINSKVIHEIDIKIRALESFACNESDLVYVVSENDYNYFSSVSNDTSKILLIQNGVSNKRFKNVDESILNRLPEKYFAFVGSAHLPNVTGFVEMFAKSLGFLPPDVKVVVIGGVGKMLKADRSYLRYKNVYESRIVYLKDISFPQLDAILLNSLAILLPVVEGGGTNLKTAEALLSSNRIIGTSKSFVGYEEFISSEGVYIANSPFEFMVCMKNSLEKMDTKTRLNVEKLTWQYNLKVIDMKVSDFYG